MTENTYRLGTEYRDNRGIKLSGDQFLRWINIEGSGMGNSGGIRALNYLDRSAFEDLPAFVVLVTAGTATVPKNPWSDFVDFSSAEISYWGDAKLHASKRLDDFKGNSTLRKIYDASLEGTRDALPPFLHFSREKSGWVKFNGLCVLRNLELSWFDDEGTPIRNYHARFTILDCDEVSVEWLHHRVCSPDRVALNDHHGCPQVWKDYIAGKTTPIDIWQKSIRDKTQQLPEEGSDAACILQQLSTLDPFDFEKVIVALFMEQTAVVHHVAGTKSTGDGGFDFYGTFKLPEPLAYEISFLGEVKRYAANTVVDPKSVSRLVARLSRKQYGIFVTTSYFSNQAQREVLEDDYPVHLMSGIDLASMVLQLKLTDHTRKKMSADWLSAVLSGSRSGSL